MSISRILSECPTIQRPLGELFMEVGQREQLPFAEFVNSPENSSMIKMEVSPGRGKLRTVEARWIQRLPESTVTEGVDILSCTATDVYGDSTTTYTLDTTDTYGWNQLISADEIARHCQDNDRYILESILRGLDTIDRATATAMATQTVAQLGGWGTEVSGYYTVAADFLQLATRQTGGQALNEFTMADVLQATRMANYPGAPNCVWRCRDAALRKTQFRRAAARSMALIFWRSAARTDLVLLTISALLLPSVVN